MRNFYGAQQGNLVIHAAFGGLHCGYIATGTESKNFDVIGRFLVHKL